MTCLEHARIYSGERNYSQRYAWICRSCGAHGWSDKYVVSQVNLDEYLHLRVTYGWQTPRFPAPPKVPTPARTRISFAVAPMVFWLLMFMMIGVAGLPLPWFEKPLLEIGDACIGSGVSLLCGTLCYVAWKGGY